MAKIMSVCGIWRRKKYSSIKITLLGSCKYMNWECELVSYSSYSPDLALSDCYPFPIPKKSSCYNEGIDALEHDCNKCVEGTGENIAKTFLQKLAFSIRFSNHLHYLKMFWMLWSLLAMKPIGYIAYLQYNKNNDESYNQLI